MKKFICLFIIIIFSCEKDDICSDTTQTTPRVVLEFYDLESPNEVLLVPGLFARGVGPENMEILINNEVVLTRSTISLPLKTDGTNEAEFILSKSYDIVDGVESGNRDTLKITYTTETVYVSRACGYKTNFTIETFSITEDADQWMRNSEILINEITNENEIHVKILH